LSFLSAVPISSHLWDTYWHRVTSGYLYMIDSSILFSVAFTVTFPCNMLFCKNVFSQRLLLLLLICICLNLCIQNSSLAWPYLRFTTYKFYLILDCYSHSACQKMSCLLFNSEIDCFYKSLPTESSSYPYNF
jgi:hypothetical protein